MEFVSYIWIWNLIGQKWDNCFVFWVISILQNILKNQLQMLPFGVWIDVIIFRRIWNLQEKLFIQ